MIKTEFKTVGLTALGGTLEFYDFTIYGLFAPYISQHFFENSDPFIGFMNTFAVFALGYLVRPLGGIVFGHLGDKWGRKIAFLWAVFIMAVATLLMGCLPDYQSIGILAPLALMVLRLMQGFSVGGEIPGAIVFTFEHVATQKRGLFIGLIFMCITLGNTLGGVMGLILTTILNETQMMAWGWRIPFILGFFLGLLSFYIRRQLVETPVFTRMMEMNQLCSTPFLNLMKQYRPRIVTAFLLTAAISTITSFIIYLPTYLSTVMNMKLSYTYFINVISFLSIALSTAVWGIVSDYYNRKRLMVIGSILLMLCVIPLFYGLSLWGAPFIWICHFKTNKIRHGKSSERENNRAQDGHPRHLTQGFHKIF